MCGKGSCDGSCMREGDTHDHRCAECGHWFECAAGWTEAEDADGRIRPRRRCDSRTVCEECRKDAFDYACEKADADNKGEKES